MMPAKKRLPRGLREFRGSLSEPRLAGKLLPRLLDLPESGLQDVVQKHRAALGRVEEAERALARAVREAAAIADAAFLDALSNWTIPEIQKATGYDDT
jgi:hypothetical protein